MGLDLGGGTPGVALQMEFGPIPIEDLREAFHALHAALVV
ncbi:hypothetical protein Pmi06nite_06270 [Planotetraspora mira]|uniref:Uncharacterized protein n=1 Tax=Planotetraspora mira TaxID=58121 RepID=A0A8J3X468_9ACTN|nr:hypothetical protein Pmi06nite_06270 [Planotetraspora mira]